MLKEEEAKRKLIPLKRELLYLERKNLARRALMVEDNRRVFEIKMEIFKLEMGIEAFKRRVK